MTKMSEARRLLPAFLLLAGLGFAACESSTDPDDTFSIEMRDNVFVPATANISAGTTVRWTNEGSTPHTTTSDAWDSGPLNPGAAAFARRFDTPGTFNYVCTLHEGMTGTIVVN